MVSGRARVQRARLVGLSCAKGRCRGMRTKSLRVSSGGSVTHERLPMKKLLAACLLAAAGLGSAATAPAPAIKLDLGAGGAYARTTILAQRGGACYGSCASEQGMCIASCAGSGTCIAGCAAAHGRCVASCSY